MAKFELGQITETAGVNKRRKEDRFFDLFVRISFLRYKSGDWGDMDAEDIQVNEDALKNGERLMGSYIFDAQDILNYLNAMHNGNNYHPKEMKDKDPDGLKIWIITEWDRSCTTILFPSEY